MPCKHSYYIVCGSDVVLASIGGYVGMEARVCGSFVKLYGRVLLSATYFRWVELLSILLLGRVVVGIQSDCGLSCV